MRTGCKHGWSILQWLLDGIEDEMNEDEFREKDVRNILTKVPQSTQEDVDRYVASMKVSHSPLIGYQETLRDRFAMAALNGLLSQPTVPLPEIVAKLSYQFADFMLEARKK